MSKIFHSLIFRFIIVTLVFFAATSPIIVLFGPFGNLKRAVVGAIMRSRHPQYITWLYNQEELNEILGVVKTTEQTQVLSFKPRTDSTLSLQKIETTRFVGYLLEIPNPQRIQVATAEDIQEKGDTTIRIAKKNMIPMVREPAACLMGLLFMKESICSGSRWMIKNGSILSA